MQIKFKTYIYKDKKLRFQLVRGDNNITACFLMLNPSNADDCNDDPTIRRCRHFSENNKWKSSYHDGFIVVNLFPFITSNPKNLVHFLKSPKFNTTLEKNDKHIDYAFRISKTIIFAYGVLKNETYKIRAHQILKLTNKPIYCLKKTKEGFPSHPLYLSSKEKIKPYCSKF